MHRGDILRFIVDPDTAGRMDRVVVFSDGRIVEKKLESGGVSYTVVKI